jgi:hypothetical protein
MIFAVIATKIMSNKQQDSDRRLTAGLFAVFVILLLVVGFLLFFFFFPFIISITEEGLSLKGALIYAFFITISTLVVLAIAAGDGLLGEIQYMIGAFAGFFLITWFIIALVF